MNRVEPGGGWISGSESNPLPPVAPENRMDDSLVVGEAFDALNAYSDILDRSAVRLILPFWRNYTDLTAKDMVAILKRFPGKGDL